MKTILTGLIVMFISVAYGNAASKAGTGKELNFTEEGYQLDNNSIIRIDRDRIFEELTIVNPVSTEKCESHMVDENGKKVPPLFPFQYASVRKLVIDNRNDKIGKLMTKKGLVGFETISFTGIKDLEEIVFKGEIIPFKENKKWFGIKTDSDWRKGLKKVVFEDDLGFEKIPFLSDVKCIVLGTNTYTKLEQLNSNDLKAISRCKNLEKIVVPYELACNTNIAWRNIIERTGLKEKEVFSQGSCGNNYVDDRVLLNIAASGEISDIVTEIRADAINQFAGRKIFLSSSIRRFLGVLDKRQSCKFALKKNTVIFYPAIDLPAEKRKLEKSHSLFSHSSIALASAYSNIVISVNGKYQNSEVAKNGSAYISAFKLKRDTNKKSDISLGVKVDGTVYPVQFFNNKGTLFRDPITVKFEYSAYGMPIIVCTAAVWILLSLLLAVIYILAGRKFGIKRFGVPIFLITSGLFMAFFGNGYTNLLQDLVDRWLTDDVMSYLNASFVSSLVISVTTTLVKFVVGLLQGISANVVFLSFNVGQMLEPVQDVLDKISTYSWISTGVLAFVRIFCQMIRDAAHIVWPILGLSIVSSTILRMFNSSFCSRNIRRWLGVVSVFCGFLALGLPAMLWGASCISGLLADISGAAFENSMRSFGNLAELFSVSSLTSLAAMKELMAQFADAMAELTSASMYYVANKAFDCFVVPLGLYFIAKKAFSGTGDKKDMELSRIREVLEGDARHHGGFIGNAEAGIVPAMLSVEKTINDEEPVSKVVLQRIGSDGMLAWLKTLRPEWITASCGVLLCVLVAVGSIGRTEVVVGTTGSPVVQAETPPIKNVPYSSTGALAWIVGAFFVSAFIGANYCLYRKAMKEKDAVAKDGAFGAVQSKLALLKEKGFWFDLPLYLGLLGTVIGFLIISWAESLAQVGRVVSYFSTITGILTSVIIHAKVSLYRAKALREGEAKDE